MPYCETLGGFLHPALECIDRLQSNDDFVVKHADCKEDVRFNLSWSLLGVTDCHESYR